MKKKEIFIIIFLSALLTYFYVWWSAETTIWDLAKGFRVYPGLLEPFSFFAWEFPLTILVFYFLFFSTTWYALKQLVCMLKASKSTSSDKKKGWVKVLLALLLWTFVFLIVQKILNIENLLSFPFTHSFRSLISRQIIHKTPPKTVQTIEKLQPEEYDDPEDFSENILEKQDKPFYLISKYGHNRSALILPGINSFLSGLYVHLDENALKDAETIIAEKEEVITHGYFKDVYIDTPVSLSSSKTIKKRYRILYVDDIKKIEFSQLNCPEQVNPETKFQAKLWLRNPFNEGLTVNVLLNQSRESESLHSEIKKAVNLSPNQESELVFEYKTKKDYPGNEYIYYNLFGKNESGIVYLAESCTIKHLKNPELSIRLEELESGKRADDYIVGSTKLVKFRVANVGDFEIRNINLKIRPEEGLFVNPTNWYIEKLSGREERIFSFDLINSSKTLDDFSFIVNMDIITSTPPPEDNWMPFLFYIKPKP